MDCTVINNWTDKVVFSGTKQECIKYLNGNNTYQSNYSKLKYTSSLENLAEKIKGRELFTEKKERAKVSLSENKTDLSELLYMHRDKTKEYKTDYDNYSIITFWKDETKSIQAGWFHKIINI